MFFGLKPDGDVDILYDWEKMDEVTAKKFAELLYRLNLGVFEKTMLGHLVEIKGKSEKFSHKIIERWVDLLNSNNPVVRPLKVLRTESEEEQ